MSSRLPATVSPPPHRSFRRPSPVPSRCATSLPRTPRSPCSPTVRRPTVPRYTTRSCMVDDNILKLDNGRPGVYPAARSACCPYDVERQIETFASFDGHVIIQTMFLSGEYRGKSLDTPARSTSALARGARAHSPAGGDHLHGGARDTGRRPCQSGARGARQDCRARARPRHPLPGELLAKPRSS